MRANKKELRLSIKDYNSYYDDYGYFYWDEEGYDDYSNSDLLGFSHTELDVIYFILEKSNSIKIDFRDKSHIEKKLKYLNRLSYDGMQFQNIIVDDFIISLKQDLFFNKYYYANFFDCDGFQLELKEIVNNVILPISKDDVRLSFKDFSCCIKEVFETRAESKATIKDIIEIIFYLFKLKKLKMLS